MGKELGTFIRKAREKAELSQGQVASDLGLKSPQYISNVERGVAPLSRAMLPKISRMLKIRAEDLIDVIVEEVRAKYLEMLSASGKRAKKSSKKSR